jgi:type III secretory pathway component EscU
MGDLRMDELTKNGFIIYPKDTSFAVQKVSTPNNPKKIEEKVFSTHQEAVDFAKSFLKRDLYTFTAIVRYNRKLGVEYKNLPLIEAKDIETARAKANLLAQDIIGEQYIIEVRVRPKND